MHMLLSDIWSRSNFWATLHFLSADVSNTIDPFTHLQTESVTFVAHVAFINKIVYMQCRTLWYWRIHQLGRHVRLCGHLSGHGWLCGWIVLNSYFSITLKKKDWSFYWYFLWECLWSKNSTKSVKHISNNFIQDFCLSKAAIMDTERKFSNSPFDSYRFHHGWTNIDPTLRIWKLLTASGVRSLCASLTEGST